MSTSGPMLLLLGSLAVLVAGKSVPVLIDKDAPGNDRVNAKNQEAGRVPFNLEETYDFSLRSHAFNGTWKSDTGIHYIDKYNGDILEFDVTTRQSKILVDASVTSRFDDPMISFSHDDSHLLITHDFTAGFRHSIYKKGVVYNVKRRTYTEIANGMHIPLAKWSPSKNALAFVLENDIYYQTFSKSGKHQIQRVTNTGVPGVFYNGLPDWVYEEEVLASDTALWFSRDGRYLAFASFDDAEVKNATMLYYGKPGSLEDQYPTEVKIKYPKAGTPNPVVSLSVVDLTSPSLKIVNLAAPVDVIGADHILYAVSWWSDRVTATWTNRVQNKSLMVLYDVQGVASNVLYDEEPDGWLRIRAPLFHEKYAIVLKTQDSGTPAGRFLHATRFEYVDGRLTKGTDLTPGKTEVQAMLAIDHVRGRLYYLAAGDEPSQRNLYSVNVDGTEKPVCVSCGVSTPEGNLCTYATASFSKRRSHYALTCSGPDPVSVTIFNANHSRLLLWEDNPELREKLAERTQPLTKNLYVKANGYYSNVRLLLPPDFDETKSYPLLINVYAGPNTVRITETATYGFHSYMTTNRSVIYGWIDGRGSAYRGSKILFEIYRRMGTVEIEDQITVTGILQETYPWIDANRTAIWGWSYGGFSTAMVLATDRDSVFKCGISVAPVSSWIYYDSIYTERIMGLPTPEDNIVGYNQTDVASKVEGIRGKKFLLIHGTADDNVHYQQAMALNKALVDKDIMFQFQSYTDEAHGLIGSSPHLYHTMDRFWANCLGYSSAN